MQQQVWAALAAGVLLAVGTAACTGPASTPDATTSPEAATTASDPADTASSPAETAGANLNTYDETAAGMAVVAQYPDTMQVEGGCSTEGCGYHFSFLPQGNALDEAEVHVFLPAGVATAADQEPFVTGPNGLIENAGWIVDSTQMDGSEQFPYAWVEEVINFSTDREESGHVLLGQTDGQAVQVLLKYPAEMSDAYWAGAKVILDSLSFDADLLPIGVSTEGATSGEDPSTMCDPATESC